MKKIEDIMTSCIADIKEGRTTLDACLERYPDLRHELEPLLRLALNIKEAPAVRPSDVFKIRTRVVLMEQIHASRKTSKQPQGRAFGFTWSAGWLRATALIVAVIMALSAMSAGTAYASQESLPGDTLYPVKISTEQFRLFLATDESKKMTLELGYTGTRLQELEAIAQKAPERLETAANGYEKQITEVVERANRGVPSEWLEEVSLTMLEQMTAIDGIDDNGSATSAAVIHRAKGFVISQQAQVLRSLAIHNSIRSFEINLDTEQSTLERALDEAVNGQTMGMQESIRHFMQMSQLGDEIAEIARQHGHSTDGIARLSAMADNSQLETLGTIQEKVSGNAAQKVEEAMSMVRGRGNMMQGNKSDLNIPAQTQGPSS
ncbi:DUF5667 domain-containing protein [Chloroflexota bacterium]